MRTTQMARTYYLLLRHIGNSVFIDLPFHVSLVQRWQTGDDAVGLHTDGNDETDMTDNRFVLGVSIGWLVSVDLH